MRVVVLAVLAACSSSGRPDWDSPPSRAVAKCTYEQEGVDEYIASSRLHFDDRGRIVQYDGFRFEDVDLVRTSTVIEYDADDRVVRKTNEIEKTVITYAPNEAIEKTNFLTLHYDLDAVGRVLRRQGPLEAPVASQAWITYEYDALGRVTRHGSSDGHDSFYSYDAEGRLAARVQAQRAPTTIAYTQNGSSLEVREMAENSTSPQKQWTIHVDEQGRIDRVDYHPAIVVYSYGPDFIEEKQDKITRTAKGKCPAPTVSLVPPRYEIGAELPIDRLAFPGTIFVDARVLISPRTSGD
jgi:YD repeat-containing protein